MGQAPHYSARGVSILGEGVSEGSRGGCAASRAPYDLRPPERSLDGMHDHASAIGVTVRYPTSEQADIVVRLLAHQRAASRPGLARTQRCLHSVTPIRLVGRDPR